ncbi:ABC transporter permease [Aestuariirhabdus litorea]|uniref:ABC transporter permease n=1 Tax=Aestuariirhabdus litorea TaxID=2528527 RepID=A0A3P3VNB4_9GAMM|nr:ABC transporter permease [Aestuariirhabdus litorea]RRJ83914.1 ABC transporter permease [Aestuariirhabdus litorea]RWW97136.1 ABC transporter permease subunit [Endozoicomonadaceae bacterium GTF-13]
MATKLITATQPLLPTAWLPKLAGLWSPERLNQGIRLLLVPLAAMALFLFIWHLGAPRIVTSLGQVPGPVAVWEQAGTLWQEHLAERDKEQAFYERQQVRNSKKLQKNPDAEVRIRPYTGKPTYIDQILTSLTTVFAGFGLASLVAIPMGILCGLNATVYRGLNPLIQIFKPVSPLAWLPIVTMVVSALYVSDDPLFSKSFVTSAITVMLCCMWPTLINTTVGVASIEQDLLNVSKVLRLNWWVHIYRVVLPSAIPMIFTGLRLSLGVGWMVLIAAEMLAQNPGLGKFVWDEFQNGSSHSLGRIMIAVITIGFIGYLLDRIMLQIQKAVSWDKSAILR